MLISSSPDLEQLAQDLVQDVAQACERVESLGRVNCADYDTAWLSMIIKSVNGEPVWLFPECFRYLLTSQHPEGGWGTYLSEVDGILSTMAVLWAFKVHARQPEIDNCHLPGDLDERSEAARQYLRKALNTFDVDNSDMVAFEMLIPVYLDLLEKEGISFDFPGRPALMALHRKKMAKFDPRMIYAKQHTTIVHSLEAFIGKIDFGKVSHHLVNGSMMCSPSSTAAYLIYSPTWDDDAEAFLRRAVNHGNGKGAGAVPDVFPTSVYEIVWVRSEASCYPLSILNLNALGNVEYA